MVSVNGGRFYSLLDVATTKHNAAYTFHAGTVSPGLDTEVSMVMMMISIYLA